MDTILIDGTEYKTSSLSQTMLEQLMNLQKLDAEIQNQQYLLIIAQKARAIYAAALSAALPTTDQ